MFFLERLQLVSRFTLQLKFIVFFAWVVAGERLKMRVQEGAYTGSMKDGKVYGEGTFVYDRDGAILFGMRTENILNGFGNHLSFLLIWMV